MSGVVPVVPRFRFNDANGNPLANGSVTVYLAGTTTPASVYQDKALTTSQQNPVPLDANGEALFWYDGSTDLKFLLKDSGGATVSGWPVDNIPGTASNREIQITSNDLASASANTVFTRARDSAGVGGVIRVKSGTYTLNSFAMNVADQLWEFDPNATIHSSNAGTVPAAIISANGVKVRGGVWDNQALSSDAFAQVACIKVNAADDVEITQGVYKAARGPCIDAYGVNRFKVSDNTFKDTWYAAVFVRPQGADIQDIEVSGNRILNTTAFAGYQYGINVHTDDAMLYKVSGVIVRGNTIRFPVIVAGQTPLGIELYGGKNDGSAVGGPGKIEGATVNGNAISGGAMGISLSHIIDSAATGNSVLSPRLYGIEVVEPYSVAVTGNSTNGGQIGVSLSMAGVGAVASGNTIRGTTVAGVFGSSVGKALAVTNNAMSVTSGAGVYLLSTSYFTVAGNNLQGNGTGNKAVMLDKSDRGVVSGNTGADWTQNGILLFADNAVTYNRVIGANNVWINTPNSHTLATQLSGGAAIGIFFSYIGNYSDVDTTTQRDVPDVSRNRIAFSGVGTPEGAVTAGIGSTFLRRDGGASTVLYIKESGTGNTGWVAK